MRSSGRSSPRTGNGSGCSTRISACRPRSSPRRTAPACVALASPAVTAGGGRGRGGGRGVPDRYGGVGLDPATEAQTFSIIATELARGDSGLADKLVQNWKISVLLRSLAPPHLQDTWFQRYMADPQFLMAHCLTEPRGASDRWLPYNALEAHMDTTAGRVGGHWII